MAVFVSLGFLDYVLLILILFLIATVIKDDF